MNQNDLPSLRMPSMADLHLLAVTVDGALERMQEIVTIPDPSARHAEADRFLCGLLRLLAESHDLRNPQPTWEISNKVNAITSLFGEWEVLE